jgi:hypothetical protein
MRALALFALAALLPAALGAAPVSERTLAVPVCSADGLVRMIELPLDDPGKEQAPCWTKGCHGGTSRRTLAKAFDPSQ